MLNNYQITSDMIDLVYNCLEGDEDLLRYHQEHGTPSLLVLTQYSPQIAQETARLINNEYSLSGKVIIEIGAGVGFLAIELAKLANQVFAIEVDPAWSWVFTRSLYAHKPPNLTWIFGQAESVLPWLKGDVAIILTHSGKTKMEGLGRQFAPIVVMPFNEIESDIEI